MMSLENIESQILGLLEEPKVKNAAEKHVGQCDKELELVAKYFFNKYEKTQLFQSFSSQMFSHYSEDELDHKL